MNKFLKLCVVSGLLIVGASSMNVSVYASHSSTPTWGPNFEEVIEFPAGVHRLEAKTYSPEAVYTQEFDINSGENSRFNEKYDELKKNNVDFSVITNFSTAPIALRIQYGLVNSLQIEREISVNPLTTILATSTPKWEHFQISYVEQVFTKDEVAASYKPLVLYFASTANISPMVSAADRIHTNLCLFLDADVTSGRVNYLNMTPNTVYGSVK